MLSAAKIVATIGTSDIKAARDFYSGVLGLPEMIDMGDAVGYLQPDGSSLFVYQRPGHRAPENTVITLSVPASAFDTTRAALASKGVRFEDYDMPGLKTEDGVATMPDGGGKASWFKDPDGQVLSLTGVPG